MTALILRILALISMLIDHMYIKVFPEQLWMNCFGRLAFPIFAFQLTDGYQKTGNKAKYTLRLLLFAVLSEVPFDLMTYSKAVFWGHQNVLWTLLLGFLVLWAADLVIRRWCDRAIRFCALFCLIIAASTLASLLHLDYGGQGILLIFVFYMLQNKPRTTQLLAVLCVNLLIGGPCLDILGLQFPIQVFGSLSLVPIWLYNGRQGHRSKVWSRFCYVFYPLHLLVLSFF